MIRPQPCLLCIVKCLELPFTPPWWSLTCCLGRWGGCSQTLDLPCNDFLTRIPQTALSFLPVWLYLIRIHFYSPLSLFLPFPVFSSGPLCACEASFCSSFSNLSYTPHSHHHYLVYLAWLLFLWSMAFTAVFLFAKKYQHGKICFSCLIEKECDKGRAFVILGIYISPGGPHVLWTCLSLNLKGFQNFVYLQPCHPSSLRRVWS